MEYRGILPERKSWVKPAAFLVSAYMLFLSAMRGQWFYVPIVLLVLLACFFQKEHIVSDAGVDIHYLLFGMSRHNVWTWEELTSLHTDRLKARPNVQLHFGRDIAVRTFVMTPADCRAVLELAQARNPRIYIEDLSEAEQARRADKGRRK